MSVISNFFSHLKTVLRRGRLEDDLSEELQFHLRNEIQKNIAAGMNSETARYTALRSFGGVEQVKEQCRDVRGVRFFEELWQDVRYGLRMLRRNPGFATVVSANFVSQICIAGVPSCYWRTTHQRALANREGIVRCCSGQPKFRT